MSDTIDLQRLIVSMEANYKKLENQIQKAGGVADRGAKVIEDRFRKMNNTVNNGFKDFGKDISGRLEEMSGRLGPAASLLTAMGPAGLAAAAGLGALAFGLGSALGRIAEAEKNTRRLEAVLRTTGYAAGMTAGDIDKIASSMERATGIAADDVKAAAAGLATFTTIGTENFQRTLKVASDLSAVFGGGLKENVDRVARALDDPIEGFAALKKAGFSLADSELEVVKGMLRIGDVAGAQRVVLQNLEKQIGGAAAAQSGGLSGAFEQAKGAVGRFFDELANRSGVADAAAASLRGVAAAADSVTTSMQRSDFQKLVDDLEATQKQLADTKSIPDEFMGQGDKFSAIETLTGKIEFLKQKIDEGTAAEKAFQAGLGYERLNAVYSEQRAQAEASNDKFRGLITTQKEAIRATETNAEKLVRIRQEFDKTMAELANPAATVDPKLVAQARVNAELIYKNQSDAVKKAMAAEQRASLKDDTRLDTFGRSQRRAEEEILALEREAEAVGMATRERDRLRVVIEMESAAREANRAAGLKNIEVTDAQREAIDAYADRVAAAMERVREASDQYQEIQQLQREFGGLAIDGIEGLIDGTKSLNDVLADTLKRLAQMVIQAAILGDGPLSGILGTKSSSGGVGGLIGGIAKAIGFDTGGYTGDGARDQPAGIVHKGEYVFDKKSTARLGVKNLEALRGYAGGGPVGSIATPSISGICTRADSAPTLHLGDTHIDARGSQMGEAEFASILKQNNQRLMASLPDAFKKFQRDRIL